MSDVCPCSDIDFPGFRKLAAPRCSFEKSDLQEIRFDHVFDGLLFFADDGRKRMESYRASRKAKCEGLKYFPVERIKPEGIDSERCKNLLALYAISDIVADDLIVAESFYVAIDDTRSPAAFAGYEFPNSAVLHLYSEKME